MKKLLLILPLLFSCKTSKKENCDAYGSKEKKEHTTTYVSK